MDKYLLSNTTYKYVVKAVDVAGNESVQSDIFIITTKTESVSYEEWDAKKAYEKGDRVLHEGKVYEAVQSYKGNVIQTDLCLIIMENSVSFTLV